MANLSKRLQSSLGTSNNLSFLSSLRKRARSKYITRGVIHKLVEATSTNPFFKYKYCQSWRCSSVLRKKFVDGREKIVAVNYCKQRWCVVCSRIRSAHAINTYRPKIEQLFKRPYFVTLTAKTVFAGQLKGRINEMIGVFRRILKLSYDKSRSNDAWVGLSGLRSLEVTYNVASDKYHAHFHLVVDSKDSAKFIVQQWLKRWSKSAVRKAQDIRSADAGSYVELFKYVTKLTDKGYAVPAKALDVIYQSIYKKRLLQPFGSVMAFIPEKLADDDFDKELHAQSCEGISGWLWEFRKCDWVEVSSGVALTGHKPSDKDRALWGAAEQCVPPDGG